MNFTLKINWIFSFRNKTLSWSYVQRSVTVNNAVGPRQQKPRMRGDQDGLEKNTVTARRINNKRKHHVSSTALSAFWIQFV